jgi:predicted phosphodiesterase
MRVAALYDIHGNLPALEAVLEDVRRAGVDRIVVGGDVLLGPMPRETLVRLLDLDVPVDYIHGNCESAMLLQMAGGTPAVPPPVLATLRWTAEQLDEAQRHAVGAWPATLTCDIPGVGKTLFCHATPRNDTEIFTRQTSEERLAPVFAGVDAALVVCGHTHMQMDRMVGPVRVINAGSVGMPFGDPVPCWLLLGPNVELRRTAYDAGTAAERIRRTAFPGADDFAAKFILSAPSEEAMLGAYAKAELT